MMIHEDIFGVRKAIDVVVRCHHKAIVEFNKNCAKSFEEIKQLLQGKELKCYWSKVKDLEQRIIIPFQEQEFQFELYAEWDKTRFSYKIKVKTNKKTKLVSPVCIPQEKEYFIEATCKFVFIDINETYFPVREQLELFNRVDKLEILPKTRFENDLEIWDKYILAQEILLTRYAQPFAVKRYHPLKEIKSESGDLTGYKFKVDLHPPDISAFKKIEEELKTEFQIDEQFDANGNITLKNDDIFRGLDYAIEKKFKSIIEREKAIICVLQIRPLPLYEMCAGELKKLMPNCNIENNTSGQISVFSSDKRINQIPADKIREYGLCRLGVASRYFVTDRSGITSTVPRKKRLPDYISTKEFEQAKYSFGTESIIQRKSINGQGNFKVSNVQIGEYYQLSKKIDRPFSREFWVDLKRDLYKLDFKAFINESANTISFEFNDFDECISKFKRLKDLKKFGFSKTPHSPDFGFKVKTQLIKHKLEKELFKERLDNLRDVDFHFALPAKEGVKRTEYLAIGKLIAKESNNRSLVFSIPFWRKDGKAIAKKLLECIEEKLAISSVEPSLKGDQAKVGWAKQAMEKLSNPSEKPNGRPVNEKLSQFIFDSSKAEEIFKDISKGSEEWQRVQSNEMLKLNDSQREAVVAALNARDLSLIQGPPGTGKTTVIAELTWQLISQNQSQKILLTSETNLAVDNAIEKLINKEHTLVKPLRFGQDSRFEEEGKKYSFNRIMKWVDEKFLVEEFEDDSSGENDDDELVKDDPRNNAVQIWMNRIAESAHKKSNGKYANALKDWAIELSQPGQDLKKYFADKYFKFTNVVGSTCSAAGSVSFSQDYTKIFHPDCDQKVANEILWLAENRPDSQKIWKLLDKLNFEDNCYDGSNLADLEIALKQKLTIVFDVVIMDEASKATPPEMLVPLSFGKKSIVIGDHKQLPPMMYEKEFKEALLELKDPRATALAEDINREFVDTSQFERLIMNPKVPKTIIARLNEQYRMHPKINNVIRQFYSGETDKGLYSAQELIDHCDDKDLSNPFSRYHGLLHDQFINPDIHTIWVNVDEPEQASGNSRINQKEVEVVKTVLTYLKNSTGFNEYFEHWESIEDAEKRREEKEVGLISFYGHQTKKLQEVRKYAQNELNIPVRLKTVDKFQGMERNIVIVSTVRSNKAIRNGMVESNQDIGFAKSPKRLNVALSRPKRLLIVVGNLTFFESYRDKSGNVIYKNAIDIIRKEGLIIDDYKKLNCYK